MPSEYLPKSVIRQLAESHPCLIISEFIQNLSKDFLDRAAHRCEMYNWVWRLDVELTPEEKELMNRELTPEQQRKAINALTRTIRRM